MNPPRQFLRSKLLALAVATATALPAMAEAQQTEVRWGQWKGTEVGAEFMAELESAFEADHPEVDLVLVDSPFTGFHDRAIATFVTERDR